MSVHLDCVQVVTHFLRGLDHRRYDAMVDLMHPQGTWLRMGKVLTRDTMLRELAQRSTTFYTKHILTNLVGSCVGEDRFILEGYLLVIRFDDGSIYDGPAPLNGIFATEDWCAELRQVEQKWKIFQIRGRQTFLSL
ncbi:MULTISPECIES: nuclear transport factor 2 family protein [unclassified Shinella]|uniref:nuclear transport factor 2 family protein n=1 Tax=unclassified Shinella TaxID=2643062 RepID=UPI00234F1C68|nr:nuclear transport factor 2 family protein [Shinella sp. YE25]MDC7260129.1 nuclear transport factor 2 family protein [Shinella sp. YE25]